MIHVDPEQLAGQAAGEPEALETHELAHLDQCAACRSLLTELQHVSRVVSTIRPDNLESPALRVWGQVRAEIEATVAEQSATGPEPSAAWPALPAPAARERDPRRSALTWVVAAVVGLVMGAGGTVLAQRWLSTPQQVVSSVALQPLPGRQGRGAAELVRDGATPLLRVQVETAVPLSDYRELWLINVDGSRMYSLGSLPPDGTGSFPLPSVLTDGLNGFTIVDVSLEPDDGNPLHSRHSLVRGTLPT